MELILVDRPYISDFFRKMSEEHGFPIVGTKVADELGFSGYPDLIAESDAIHLLNSQEFPLIYTTSENALAWIANNLSHTALPEKINLFKNKAAFRRLIQPLLPDFSFREVSWDDLDSLLAEDLPVPFVIKPSVGFFSMGVHKVTDPGEWGGALKSIKEEIRLVSELYPREVLDAASFVVEEVIEGEEFAIDAYFDSGGAPVIVGLYHHIFGSGEDVSDRVYYTSRQVIEQNLDEMTKFLHEVGKLSEVRNFPIHAEVRRTREGQIVPVEINPMRFGGWCSTPDMTSRAYGVNPYLSFLRQEKPDWTSVLEGKGEERYSIIVMENPTGIKGENIAAFDYERFVSHFSHPLELRKIDYREYPVFCFLFTETPPSSLVELTWVLKADPREFITLVP